MTQIGRRFSISFQPGAALERRMIGLGSTPLKANGGTTSEACGTKLLIDELAAGLTLLDADGEQKNTMRGRWLRRLPGIAPR